MCPTPAPSHQAVIFIQNAHLDECAADGLFRNQRERMLLIVIQVSFIMLVAVM